MVNTKCPPFPLRDIRKNKTTLLASEQKKHPLEMRDYPSEDVFSFKIRMKDGTGARSDAVTFIAKAMRRSLKFIIRYSFRHFFLCIFS